MRLQIWLTSALLAAAAPALAQDPAPAAVAAQVRALEGCWAGDGVVMGKPVVIALSARAITQDAMFLVEAESHAKADPKDRYAAHLVFGGRTAAEGGVPAISGFWIDSFGGDYTASGAGTAVGDGFDIAYAYPDATFVNRWRLRSDRLTWTIVSRNGSGPEEAFAAYDLRKIKCRDRSE